MTRVFAWWRNKARGAIFEALHKRMPFAGDLLFAALFPREILAQRKRDKAVRARFHTFCAKHDMTKVNGKWVREAPATRTESR